MKVSRSLDDHVGVKLKELLREFKDVFAYEVEEMPGIDPSIAVHKLNVDPKPNGTWRMCVDYTDLNKACPKDSSPLPKIDKLVDSTAGHALMSFMDAYSGFHQIPLWKEDQEKTAFATEQGLYCYQVMPFGLKNAPWSTMSFPIIGSIHRRHDRQKQGS